MPKKTIEKVTEIASSSERGNVEVMTVDDKRLWRTELAEARAISRSDTYVIHMFGAHTRHRNSPACPSPNVIL